MHITFFTHQTHCGGNHPIPPYGTIKGAYYVTLLHDKVWLLWVRNIQNCRNMGRFSSGTMQQAKLAAGLRGLRHNDTPTNIPCVAPMWLQIFYLRGWFHIVSLNLLILLMRLSQTYYNTAIDHVPHQWWGKCNNLDGDYIPLGLDAGILRHTILTDSLCL
jgi:hypothetical protein